MFTKLFFFSLNRTNYDVIKVCCKWYNTKNIANNVTKLNEQSSVQFNHISPHARSEEFIDWFRGFVDAEGCFLIIHRKGNTFEFEFSIKLHVDDKAVLDYILNKLKVGVVRVGSRDDSVTYKVTNQKQLAVIVDLFSKYNLNTTKHLNFLAFAKAYNLYMTKKSPIERGTIKPVLLDLKNSMNNKRTNFDMPKDHIVINGPWLLGFFEGDGSFFFSNNRNTIGFALTQKGNLDLMNAIKEFLTKLSR